MRARALASAVALALALAAPALAPLASATMLGTCGAPAFGVAACAGESSSGPDCGRDFVDVAAGHAGASASGERYCGADGSRADLVQASVLDGTGRESVRWDGAGGAWGYREVAIERAPWLVDWYFDQRSGCSMVVAVPLVPATDVGCPVTAPPPPPGVAWGALLP